MARSSVIRVLELIGQPAFLLHGGKVCYANPAALSIGIQPELRPEHFLYAKYYPIPSAQVQSFACSVGGTEYKGSVSALEDSVLYLLEPAPAQTPSFPAQTLAHTASTIRSSIHEMQLSLSLLADRLTEDADEQTLRHSAAVLRGFYRLERAADNLDYLQKLRSDSYAPRFALLDLSDFLGELLSGAAELLRFADIRLEYTLPPAGARGTTDRKLLSTALWNLLANAAEHAQDNVVCVSVQKTGRDELELCVSNRSSLPLLEVEQLFSRHAVDMDDSLAQQGLGLGLSLTLEAAKALGGRLILSQAEKHEITATLRINVGPRETDKLCSDVLLPKSGVNEALVGLSSVLPPTAFDPRDLIG